MLFLFDRMNLDEAFELLLNRKIVAKELKQAIRVINKLKEDDWRLWFGRFLVFVRSDAEHSRFTDAYICLSVAEEILESANDPTEKEKFNTFINNESLFLTFKFYYEATGLLSIALWLARAYQNGWGVKRDMNKAREFAMLLSKMEETYPLYKFAQEVMNNISLEAPDELAIEE